MTAGVGLTIILKVEAVPAQPLEVGVTVMVAVTGAFVAFVAVKALIFPVPVAFNPIVESLLVHV